MPVDPERWRVFLLHLVDEAEAAGAPQPERLALDQFVRLRRAMWWAHYRMGLHAWEFRTSCHVCQDLAEHVPEENPDADEAEA